MKSRPGLSLGPKILFLDIETAPVIAAVWPPLHDPNGVVWIERGTYMLSFAAKWAHGQNVKTFTLADYSTFRKNPHCDKSLLTTLHEMISESDIVVAHNGDAFDLRVIRARLLINKMPPIPPVKQVDTLKWARSIGKFDSNRLDALCQSLELGRKLPTRSDLWRRCAAGDRKAFKAMRRYNAHDVRLLEAAYNAIRPLVQNGPDLTAYQGKRGQCPSCGSKQIQSNGFRVARSKKYRRLQCQGCGHWFHGAVVK